MVKEGLFDAVKSAIQHKVYLAKTGLEDPKDRINKVFHYVMLGELNLISNVKKMFNLNEDFEIDAKVDFNSDETASIATRTPPITISMGVKRFLDANAKANKGGKGNVFYGLKTDHIEYPQFANDPVIGSLHKLSIENAVLSFMTHELAHSVQQYYLYAKDWVDKEFFDLVLIISNVFSFLRRVEVDKLKASFLKYTIDDTIKKSKIKTSVPFDKISEIVYNIGPTSRPNQDDIIAAIKESNVIKNSIKLKNSGLIETLTKMGLDFDNKDDIEAHGYLFQFIYKKIKSRYIDQLKNNTTMIVETTIVPRKQDFILNFNQFVESSASVEKDKSSSKRKATDLFKGKIEIDTDLINQIKN